MGLPHLWLITFDYLSGICPRIDLFSLSNSHIAFNKGLQKFP